MKRNLLFPLAVLLFFSTNVKVQEIHEASVLPYVPNFIPTAYTQGGKVLFFTVEGGRYDNESLSNGDFTVYDADFEEVKKISVPEETCKTYTLVSRRAAVTDPFTGVVTYTGEWETTREEDDYQWRCCRSLGLCTEVDHGIAEAFENQRLFLTQTLFNEDDKFEYLFETIEVKETSKYERDRDGDGVTDEVTRSYSAVESGLEIRQDDGTVLFRHDYADLNNVMGTEAMLYRVGGKTYLVIEENGYMDGSEERFRSYTIYLIDSKANTIKELKRSSCVRAYPNPARKGEVVTMEIPIAEDKASQREVCVTSVDGRTVTRMSVEAGVRTVQIPIQRIPSGVYNFTLTEKGRVVENSRIIVR